MESILEILKYLQIGTLMASTIPPPSKIVLASTFQTVYCIFYRLNPKVNKLCTMYISIMSTFLFSEVDGDGVGAENSENLHFSPCISFAIISAPSPPPPLTIHSGVWPTIHGPIIPSMLTSRSGGDASPIGITYYS